MTAGHVLKSTVLPPPSVWSVRLMDHLAPKLTALHRVRSAML